MKRDVITVRLDPDIKPLLDRLSQRTRSSRSEIVRDALRRRLALERFRELRGMVLPHAEKRGYLLDQDVFDRIS